MGREDHPGSSFENRNEVTVSGRNTWCQRSRAETRANARPLTQGCVREFKEHRERAGDTAAHRRCQGLGGGVRKPGLRAGHPALRPGLLGLGGEGFPRLWLRSFTSSSPTSRIVRLGGGWFPGSHKSSPMPLSYCLFQTIRAEFSFLCYLLLKFRFLRPLPPFLPCCPQG